LARARRADDGRGADRRRGGPTKLDAQRLGWLRANALPHTVVTTKHDGPVVAAREACKRALAEGCDLAPGDVVWTSAARGVGIDRLRDPARLWLDLA
jgi:GTP-binding protein